MTVSFKDTWTRFYQSSALGDFMPYHSYDTTTGLFYQASSLGFVLETVPLVGCTEEMQRELSMLFKHLLPEESAAQFLLWADPWLAPVVDPWVQARQGASSVLAHLAHARRKAFQDLSSTEGLVARTFRVIISVSVTTTNDALVRTLKTQVMTLLQTLGLPVMAWTPVHLLTFGRALFGDESALTRTVPWNGRVSLQAQWSNDASLIDVTPHGLHLQPSNQILKTYRVVQSPPFWSLYAMGELIGDLYREPLQIPCPFLIHYGITIPQQAPVEQAFQAKAAWVDRQVRFPNIRTMLPHVDAQSQELAFVRQHRASGERFVVTYLSVMLRTEPDRLAQAEQALLNLFRSKEWDLVPNTLLHFPSALFAMPLMAGEGVIQDLKLLGCAKTTLTSEAANLLPLQGEWQGTAGSTGMLLLGRRGQLLTWNPFENNHGNYNVCVVGRSGSGKSVFMQDLMTSVLGMGGRVFVLDVGRSFEKVCHLLEGDFIEFTPHTPLSLNPFTHLSSLETGEQEDALAMLKPLLGLMCAPREGTHDRQNALLERSLRAVWSRYGKDASLTLLAQTLSQDGCDVAQSLGSMLFPYTDQGLYGRYFNGPATLAFHKPLVVIELEELKERKDLQAVIVQMIIVHITSHMLCGDRQTPFMIVFDEAWDLLRGKQAGDFIETLARRVRKYKGSLVVGTQSVNDFFQSPAAQAAFDNADWMALLSQKKESIALLKETKRLVMDPTMESLLQSVKTKQGSYAEIMLYGPHGYAVTRLVLDAFSKVLYSTKAQDYASVKQAQAQGLSLRDAVALVADQAKRAVV